MATGDISSVTIRADGWTADVVVTGFTTGATYAYGLGANNDPSTAKVVFTVVSLGFDNTGAATTITRTVYGVQTVRKTYSNQTVLDETGGGNLTFRMCLSDFIYAKDATGAGNSGTAPTVSISASLVNNAGGGAQNSNAVSNLTVTNNSTVAYPKMIGNFAVPQRLAVNGTEDIEFFCFHKYAQNGRPAACVKKTATGATSGNVINGAAITSMTLSNRGDLLPVYNTSMNLSTGGGFTRGELVNIKAVAYPWVGDSAAVLDTNADAGSQVFQLGDLKRTIMDKMVAVVDGVGGGTPTASTSQATADANPFSSISAAMTGIASANNSAYSLNRLDGGEVQCKAATYTYTVGSGTSTNGCFTITRHSSATRAQVIFNTSGSGVYQRAYQRYKDITFTRSSNAYIMFAANPNYLVLDGVDFADAYGAWYSGDTNTAIDYIDCTYNNGNFCKGGNDGHSRLHRNCTYTPTTQASGAVGDAGNSMFVFGFDGSGGSKALWTPLASSGTTNYIIAYSTLYAITDGQLDNSGSTMALTNVAIVCNVIERIGASSTPLAEISDQTMNNILTAHNTFAGQRFNHENDITAPYVNKTFTDYVGKFNAFNSRGDHRADIRDTDATMIGTWSVGYSVGWEGNHNEAVAYTGDTDFWGLNSNTPTYPAVAFSASALAGYTNDKSRSGSDTGGGDYRPAAGSALLNKVPAGRAMLPYDILGVAFDNGGKGTAGAYQFPIPPGGFLLMGVGS